MLDPFATASSVDLVDSIKGFDRAVFKGCLRPSAYANGAMAFLRYRGVLNKNYKQWAMAQSEMLESFLPKTFPGMERTLGPLLSYSWTLWQSEWAADYIFDSPDNLKPIMNSLARHAFMTGAGDRLLRLHGTPG